MTKRRVAAPRSVGTAVAHSARAQTRANGMAHLFQYGCRLRVNEPASQSAGSHANVRIGPLAAAGVAQHALTQLDWVALAAARQFDNAYRDSFALACRVVRQF